jgi:hypothetical protein
MKKYIVLILIILLLGLGSTILLNIKFSNEENLVITESLINKQASIEEDFEIEGYTLNNPNIILNPYEISPLTALVIFETEDVEQPKITVVGKDELTNIEGVGIEGTKHYIPIYGLYPNSENEVIIEVGDKSKIIKIKTEPLPEDLVAPSEIKANKDKLTNDFYFFTPSSKGYTTAYDVNGDIRWYLTEKLVWDISTLSNGRMLLSTERPINPPYFTTGLYEIDFLGKIYTEFALPGGYHHDFYELENGNLLVASNDFDNEAGTVEDVIVELDRESGNIVKSWDTKEVLNMEDGKSENWSNYDWFHNNSVWYDEKENVIILSGRHQDAVIAIDYDTSELKWIIGDSTNWSQEYQEYFFTPKGCDDFEWQWSQHAAMVTPEGYIFILDNGNNKSKVKSHYVSAENSYTRGVMYKIDTENMIIEQIWQYGKERGSDFYSPYISDVDYIDKNHYIVHSGGIVEVDGKPSNQPAGFAKDAKMRSTTVEILNDEEIFEITLPTNMYRVEKMNMYEQYTYELGEGSYLGGLGKTSYNSKFGLPINSLKSDDLNIELINEIDRLVVKGKFKKGQSAKVILYKNWKMNIYDIRISKRPYTALCIDVFTTDEDEDGIEVIKNINKEGLKGEYSIYLEIDNELYNTGKIIKILEKKKSPSRTLYFIYLSLASALKNML